MLKKLQKFLPFLKPAVRYLPRALAYGLGLMLVFIFLVHAYNDVDGLSWGIWLLGYGLGVLGYYVIKGTAYGIKRWLGGEEMKFKV